MSFETCILVFVFSLMASFVQRVSGFGFGILIMTILPYLMPSYGEATALSGTLAIITSLITGIQVFRYLSWKKLLPILLTFIVVSYFAVKTVASVDDASLKRVLGVIMIIASMYFFFVSGRIHLRPTVPVQVSMGTLSGLMGGFFAMQGPPAVIYFISSTDDKSEYMALTQWYFLIGNLAMSFFRAGNGFVTPAVGKAWLIGVPAVFLGLSLGAKVYDRLPIGTLKKVIYGYMAFAGIVALIS